MDQPVELGADKRIHLAPEVTEAIASRAAGDDEWACKVDTESAY